MTERLQVTARVLPDGAPFVVTGRDAWMLKELLRMGKRGVSPIDNPAPRISAYVHKLRKRYGLSIATQDEGHGGPFPGSHARYRLISEVSIIDERGRGASNE